MKRWTLRLVLVLGVVLLGLGAGEGYVRLRLAEKLVPELLQPEAGKAYFGARMLQPVEEGGVRYSGRPGASVSVRGVEYAHDGELGLRIRPPSIEKPAGTFRIVIVGDSNAYGWGVEEEATFARVLEHDLRDEGLAVEVVALAFPGYNTGDQVALLRRFGARLAPDLVLVAWYANDREHLGFHVAHDGWLFADPLSTPDAWKPFLWRSFLYRRVAVNEIDRMIAAGEYVTGEGENLVYAAAKLRELADVARDLGASCAVLDVPVLEPPARTGAVHMERDGYRAAKATAWLAEVCAAADLPRLELLDAVVGEPAPLLWASIEHKDHHPNAAAHARFAAAIRPWLRAEGLLPGP